MSADSEIEKIERLDRQLAELDDEVEIPYRYSITSYGADYTVDSLVRRMRDGSIYTPEFQRGFVWTQRQASRFIESLLLGLPVPGIFLSKDEETQRMYVIDGQQRLITLTSFYEGIFPNTQRVFSLVDVQSRYEGLIFKDLPNEDRRRLDDSIIHATIVKQDNPTEDNSSVFHIFQRINTGGDRLRPQEIRTAMYQGEFNMLLKELNKNSAWRGIYGPISRRMRDQELILRFLALYFNVKNYKSPMQDFLNKYMSHNRCLKEVSAELLSNAFNNTIEPIYGFLGKEAFRRQASILNAAIYDSVMVGVARRLERGPIRSSTDFKKRYDALIAGDDFIGATEMRTGNAEQVKERLILATKAFNGLK